MNHQLKRLTSKRVADFFVTVNSGDDLSTVKDKESIINLNIQSKFSIKDIIKSLVFTASVDERYPTTDRLNQPLPEGISMFCFPNGVQLIDVPKSPTFHTFVHTSEGGSRLLGCCLTFYKQLNDEQIKSLKTLLLHLLPPVITITPPAPLPSPPSPSKAKLYKSDFSIVKSMTTSRDSYGGGTRSGSQSPTPLSVSDKGGLNKSQSHNNSTNNLDLQSISTMPYEMTAEEFVNGCNYQELSIPYCLCLISHWTFVSSFKKLMCNLYQLSLQPCKIPIERYICNFIDDVPAPPAGRIDVTYYLNDQAISFRCPPANEPNVWSGMPLFPLFECLSPENVLSLFGEFFYIYHVLIYLYYTVIIISSYKKVGIVFKIKSERKIKYLSLQ